ncbi:MAG: AAA family ATPase [Deltaproteobacteria bacterium]|nr:AAA family ATPase [Deltaproteobacteria bacterium]
MAQQPEWLETIRREAEVRRGLVLHGNTRDLFSRGGTTYVTLPELLVQELAAFSVRAVWDSADGLRFASPMEATRWNDALRARLATPEPQGTAYDLGDEPTTATAVTRITLDALLAAYRTVIAQGVRPLLIVDWSHLLVTQPAHPDPIERTWLLQLAKALIGEPQQQVDSRTIEREVSLLVLVSANLGAVPPVVYQGEPRVRLINVPLPGRESRRSFFETHSDDLKVQAPRPVPGAAQPVARRAKIDTLVELTDQLTTADLRQVMTLSRTLVEPLRPDRLINLYRFGDQRSPWEELSEERLEGVGEALGRRVIGQPAAVDHVANMVLRAWLGLAGLQHSARRSKPKGTLFFVGPTGVGKTELAKATAEFLFGDESACIRFDMSEFNHEHSDQRLVGAPPGYVGFEEGGQLTNAVAARPFSVLLFDEIEKAHGRVLDKFLQILEDGRLTDGRGETAWFSETVIIFTSNIGASNAPAGAESQAYEDHFRSAVESHFVSELKRPELLNRLGDNIVVFQPITEASSRRGILDHKLRPLRDHVRERWGVELVLDPTVLDQLVSRARVDHGGRGLLNAVERDLVNPLATFLFRHLPKLRKGRRVVVSWSDSDIGFELEDV